MIQSRTTRQFRRLFDALPAAVQNDAKRAFRLFQSNPNHPSLRFKKLEGRETYSVHIGLGYRALADIESDCVTWFWIGSHADYDRLV